MTVRRERVTPLPTAVVAAATTWQEFPGRWKSLLDQVYAQVSGQGRNVMLYLDDVPHVEVGVELIRPCPLTAPVVRSALPGGEVATAVHRGPYENLGETHEAILAACARHGWPVAGPRWEIYGDWREDPADLETEIRWLLSTR